MQANSINSYSNAQAFRGVNAEGKKINKKAAIAAGVTTAAVVAGTIAAGVHGKKVFTAPEGTELKGLKKLGTYIAEGAKDFYHKAADKVGQAVEWVRGKFAKKADEVQVPDGVKHDEII